MLDVRCPPSLQAAASRAPNQSQNKHLPALAYASIQRKQWIHLYVTDVAASRWSLCFGAWCFFITLYGESTFLHTAILDPRVSRFCKDVASRWQTRHVFCFG
jgi:hypothetical protein